jgi:hypothetical protein
MVLIFQRAEAGNMLSWLAFLPASAGLLFGLPFSPEDDGDMYLQNISLSPNYLALQPRKLYSSWSPM